MQIQGYPVPAASRVETANSNSPSPSSSSDPTAGTDTMFMKLLTAQLKNQSPLDPVDPMQFTSQLVQFNMLDQLTQIRSLLQPTVPPSTNGTANG